MLLIRFTIICLLALALSSCSSGRTSEYLQLESVNTAISSGDFYNVSLLSSKPAVYLLRTKENTRELFLTTVRECGVNENLPLAAATRQAMAGFEQLEILSQKPVILGGMQGHFAMFKAVLDQAPLLLAVYSLRSSECLLQINCWKELGPGISTSLDEKTRSEFESDIEPLWEFIEPKIASYFDDQYRGDS